MEKSLTTTCAVCNKSLRSFGSLSKHIRDQHKIIPKQYYDQHCGVGECVVCGKPTSFVNINEGYKTTCGRSCGAIHARARLKQDLEKFEQFRARVQQNMVDMYSAMTDEEMISRRKLTQVDPTDYTPLLGNTEKTDKLLSTIFNI